MTGQIRAATFVGAVVGTALRILLGEILPETPVPAGMVVANLLGALVLGIAVTALADRADVVRAGVCTGLLGSFTTFSALMVATVDRPAATGTLLLVGSIAAGVPVAMAGARIGETLRGRPVAP